MTASQRLGFGICVFVWLVILVLTCIEAASQDAGFVGAAMFLLGFIGCLFALVIVGEFSDD